MELLRDYKKLKIEKKIKKKKTHTNTSNYRFDYCTIININD